MAEGHGGELAIRRELIELQAETQADFVGVRVEAHAAVDAAREEMRTEAAELRGEIAAARRLAARLFLATIGAVALAAVATIVAATQL